MERHKAMQADSEEVTKFVFLSEKCNDPSYVACNRPVIMVEDGKSLGKWAGLCKVGEDGEAHKIVNCSSVMVTNPGNPHPALEHLQDVVTEKK